MKLRPPPLLPLPSKVMALQPELAARYRAVFPRERRLSLAEAAAGARAEEAEGGEGGDDGDDDPEGSRRAFHVRASGASTR